jgi:hypothetical protein
MRRFTLFLLAGFIAAPTQALADKYDAWINVFRIPGIVVDSVADNGHPRRKAAVQQIKGRIGSTEVTFEVHRPGCERKTHFVEPVACRGLATYTRSVRTIEEVLGVTGGRNRQFLNAADDSVLTVRIEYDKGRCVGAAVVLDRSSHRLYGASTLVKVCGDQRDLVVDYLVQMRSSGRARNIADEAATKVALADGHYLENGPPPLDPNERWVNVYSVRRIVVESVALATRPDGRTDGYTQVAEGTLDGAPVRLVVRDVPCRNNKGVRGRCSRTDIRKTAAAPDFFATRFGVDGAPVVKRLSTPKHYGVQFSFNRDGVSCQGVYVGIAKAKNRSAYAMTFEGATCGPNAGYLVDFLEKIKFTTLRPDG